MADENDTISKDDLPVEVQEYINALEDHIEAQDELLDSKDEQIAKMQGDLVSAGLSKGDDEAFKAALAKADPAVAAVMQKQADDLKAAQEQIAKQADAAAMATMIAKAAEVPTIANPDNELASMLKQAYGVSTEFGDKFFSILKAADEQVRAGDVLLKEFGGTGAETTISKSVEAAAKELMKTNPKLSLDEAIVEVYANDPSLYDQELKEGR